MLLNNLYFRIKPLIPRLLRLSVRRWFVQRKYPQVQDIWPVIPGSERPPEGWRGWPQGKKFAFVLTHDVESAAGLARVRPLAEMEIELGFRSSYNFVPEGDYPVPKELRRWLTENGFEVGVHDLNHNGRLFSSLEEFREKAHRINYYVKEWNAAGFRSAYMLRNLKWIHELEIAYDASTFDTDPFEPEPEGVNTIFPFWVPRKLDAGHLNSQLSTLNHPRSGYVELPYTLPQDSTLFLLLRQKTNEIWKQKLDWIAQHGGMALLDTHPDYMRFTGSGDFKEFPATLYRDFLQHVKARHDGQFWHALPREVANY